MNLFRQDNTELLEKISGYETHITDLETQLGDQTTRLNELSNQVLELLSNVKESEETVKIAETIIEDKEQELETVKEELAETQEIVQEVVENAVEVDTLAAQKAAIILGELGTESVEVIDGPEEIDVMSQLKKLSGKEMVDFYNKHKLDIFNNMKR